MQQVRRLERRRGCAAARAGRAGARPSPRAVEAPCSNLACALCTCTRRGLTQIIAASVHHTQPLPAAPPAALFLSQAGSGDPQHPLPGRGPPRRPRRPPSHRCASAPPRRDGRRCRRHRPGCDRVPPGRRPALQGGARCPRQAVWLPVSHPAGCARDTWPPAVPRRACRPAPPWRAHSHARRRPSPSPPRSSIGAELPDSVSLQDIIKSMPDSVFELNPFKAWGAVAVAIASFSLSLYLISVCPWPLLPFAWAFSGTALTGVSLRAPRACVGRPRVQCARHATPGPPADPPPLPCPRAVVCGGPRLRPPLLLQEQAGGGHCGHADVHAPHLPL